MTKIDDAIHLIDETLPVCAVRELYSTDELSDLLLDIRQLLSEEAVGARVKEKSYSPSLVAGPF